jgi:hypothetical protein
MDTADHRLPKEKLRNREKRERCFVREWHEK